MEYSDIDICEALLDELDINDGSDAESADAETNSVDEDSLAEMKIESKRMAAINSQYNKKNPIVLQLPRDILTQILKWVVSSRLDVVSLANLSLVCKDFFVLSRDPSIWHLMCQRIWGPKVLRKPYRSWQDHFTSRPHVHIHGVYISKTSYIRSGSGDGVLMSSKPYYVVEYYRIMRFFPNGEVLMLTTPEEPRQVVHLLEHKNKRVQALLYGKYTLREGEQDSIITAKLTSYYTPKDKMVAQSHRYRRQNQNNPPKHVNEFNVELKLVSTSSQRKFNKLIWIHHSCCTKYEKLGTESTCVFNLNEQYPALYFNRVGSFSTQSHEPL